MSNVLTKVKTLFGFGDYDDDFDEDYENDFDENNDNVDENEDIEPIISNKKSSVNSNKVVNIHTTSSPKVTVTKPLAYEEATEICDALKNRRIVVINTSGLENKIAQRLLDFVSGACYALSGALQEIEKGVYLLTPSNVEVSSELKSELSSKALFSWSK